MSEESFNAKYNDKHKRKYSISEINDDLHKIDDLLNKGEMTKEQHTRSREGLLRLLK